MDIATCGCRPIGWTDDAAPIMQWCKLHKAASDLLDELKSLHEVAKLLTGIYPGSLMEKEVQDLIDRLQ